MTTYYPTLDQVRALAGQGNLCPIYRTINADLETPVSAYLKVARPPYSFLLESVAGGERIGRYSFIGTEPYDVFSTGADQPSGAVDPLTLVQREMDTFRLIPVEGLPPFHGGGVGYVAYDAVHYFEPRVPMPEADPQGLPESVFMFTDTLLVFDHLRHDIKVVSHARLDGGDIAEAYDAATAKIERMVDRLSRPLEIPPELLATPALPVRRRDPVQLHRAGIRSRHREVHRVHLRRRRHTGGELAAVQPTHRRPPLPGVPGTAGQQPITLHVLPGPQRVPDRRRRH